MNDNMTIDRFWEMIDRAREAAGDWEEMYETLVGLLTELDIPDLMHWQEVFSLYQILSCKNKLWAAAYLIRDGCSDDSFDYFRAWLTAHGKKVFLAALAEPESLASKDADFAAYEDGDCTFERMLGAAADACSRKRGLSEPDHNAFYAELENHPLPNEIKAVMTAEIHYAENMDEDWEEEDLETLLPNLCAVQHLQEAQQYNESGDYQAAIKECEAVLALDGENGLQEDLRFDCYYKMAVNYMNADNEAEAIRWYDRAIFLYPQFDREEYADVDADMRLYYWRGWCRLHTGDRGGALSDFQTSLTVGGKGELYRGDIYCSIGAVHNAEQRYEEAVAAFNSAMAEYAQPDSPGNYVFQMYTAEETLCNRGVALLALKRYADALRGFSDAIRANSEYWEAYRMAALCLPCLGETVLAGEIEQIHAAKCCPDTEAVLAKIAKFLGDKPPKKENASEKKSCGWFGRLFGRKKQSVPPETQPPQRTKDYSSLPEIARILTNGNARAVAGMALLAGDPAAFMRAHREWCEASHNDLDEMDADFFTLLVFAYWLCGYPATQDSEKDPVAFGAYIDWKEEVENIIWDLEQMEQNLGYRFELGKIAFSGDESTGEALLAISKYLAVKGYTLLTLDTDGDCYHLFVIRSENKDRLTRLAESTGFDFIAEFE